MRISIFRILLLLGLFFFVCIFMLFKSMSMRSKLYEGRAEDISIIKKNKELFSRHLPEEARNISYAVKPFGGVVEADFDIDQRKFEIWAAGKGWDITKLKRTHYLDSSLLHSERIEVENGYKIVRDKNEKGRLRGDIRVIYDSQKSRCYYRYYSFRDD